MRSMFLLMPLAFCFTFLTQSFTARAVDDPLLYSQIDAGYRHACAILGTVTDPPTPGQLKCWGEDDHGRLGLPDTYGAGEVGDSWQEMGHFLATINLGAGRSVLQVSTGYNHTCVVMDNKKVRCWGNNDYGQLGQGDTDDYGGESAPPDTIDDINFQPGDDLAKMVATAASATCVLTTEDKIKCWGLNNYGQLGIGNKNTVGTLPAHMGNITEVDLGTEVVPKKIVAGDGFFCALVEKNSENKVKCWGENDGGELGLGDTNHRGDGGGEMGDNLPFVNVGAERAVVDLDSGAYHTCVLFDDDTVACWGSNLYGQLGQGDNNGAKQRIGDGLNEMGDNLVTVNLGSFIPAKLGLGCLSSCAISDGGALKCWGRNNKGQLGQNNTDDHGDDMNDDYGDDWDEITFNEALMAEQVVGGNYFRCALFSNGRVKCWGDPTSGATGNGNLTIYGDQANEMQNLPYVDLGSEFVPKGTDGDSVSDGACIIGVSDDANIVKCWGYDWYGTTIGDAANEMGNFLPAIPVGQGLSVQSVARGDKHICVITKDDALQPPEVRVKCWGENSSGQLGLEDPNVNAVPRQDIRNSSHVDLGNNSGVPVFIAAGGDTNCAIFDSGDLKCWGANTSGMLGYNNEGNHRGDAEGEMGNNLPAINLGAGRTAKGVSVGRYFVCALLDNDRVKCWGDNSKGQLGVGNTNDLSTPPANPIDLGKFAGNDRKVRRISAGDYHACATFDNDEVKCWGGNQYGQLGQGDTLDIGDQAGEMGDNLLPINLGSMGAGDAQYVEAGADFSCALLQQGDVKCWGRANIGQIGSGDDENLGDGANEMGDNLLTVDLDGANVISLETGKAVIGNKGVVACALVVGGSQEFKCWGKGIYLGYGISSGNIGDDNQEMGTDLEAIDLGKNPPQP